MKKSNIILLSVLFILLLGIIVLQVGVKKYVLNVSEMEFNINKFSKIEVQNGWLVEIHKDTVTRIILTNDSLKNLISIENNELVLKESEVNSDRQKIIKIYNADTKYFKTSGSSAINYYSNSDDSLFLDLTDESNIVINKEKNNQENITLKPKQEIKYLYFSAKDKSRVNIYNNVVSLNGLLKDKSLCHLYGHIMIDRLEKTKEAKIHSW